LLALQAKNYSEGTEEVKSVERMDRKEISESVSMKQKAVL
jgi:hypothetical protein